MSQFADEPSGPIFLDQLHCSGDESKLTECSFSLIHMCSHQQDIGIICHCKYIDLVLCHLALVDQKCHMYIPPNGDIVPGSCTV